ncbi:hypothetical protein F5882DRAFT_161213 [Hyaloscypha sp. PMI_1271]|nr:hypothetical protein F5882DRAFT_161213 [Hyaloscypha sp. PMI_1271]
MALPQSTTASRSSTQSSTQSQTSEGATPAPVPLRSLSPRRARPTRTPGFSQKSLPGSPARSQTFTTVDEDGVTHLHHASPNHTNVHTECGRHSDEWLFGGLSLAEVLKGLVWSAKK